jgi:hypothetical protein
MVTEIRMEDSTEIAFFTSPHAKLECRLAPTSEGLELQLFGNRAGILSLANILLWLTTSPSGREFLTLGELPFVHLEGRLSVSIRMSGRMSKEAPMEAHGAIHKLDNGESLEWEISEDGLKQVGIWIHDLAADPGHEYDRLLVEKGSEYGIHVRMTDAAMWLG